LLLAAALLAWTQGALAAEGPREWAELYEARLLDAADGEAGAAAFNLQALLNRMSPADPLYGEVAYWLANARVALGERQLAHDALDLAAGQPAAREAALALDAQLEALDRLVTDLPLVAALDDSPGPFVHSWLFGDRGWLEMGTPEGEEDPALRWAYIVQDRHDDQITLNLAPRAGQLRKVELGLKAEGFPAFVRVLLDDDRGREFATEPLEVPTDEWLWLALDRGSFHSTDPTTPAIRPAPGVQALHLHDVTTYLSADRGPRIVWIDDLVLR
jgi:hypothetical protein